VIDLLDKYKRSRSQLVQMFLEKFVPLVDKNKGTIFRTKIKGAIYLYYMPYSVLKTLSEDQTPFSVHVKSQAVMLPKSELDLPKGVEKTRLIYGKSVYAKRKTIKRRK
jgi:hypothetical protein